MKQLLDNIQSDRVFCTIVLAIVRPAEFANYRTKQLAKLSSLV